VCYPGDADIVGRVTAVAMRIAESILESGERIPLTARILQIVDVFDALTTARPYKPALSLDETLDTLQQEVDRGWWDPDMFRCFHGMCRAGQVGASSRAAPGMN
jgi:HD-GYP domain-containing protein (c-di-GMP phosphodiesterase class II)